jgi:quinol monooxygenase YgiN
MRLMRKLASAEPVMLFGRQALAAAALLLLFASTIVPCAQAQTGSGSVHAVTYLDVAANQVTEGAALLKAYRDASRREAGNLEFLVLQEITRPNRFVIVEGWTNQATFDAHTKAAPTTQFLDALKPIRNSPPDRHMLQAFATAPGPARAEAPTGALYLVEHIDFQPTFGATAQPLVKELAESSRKEDGIIRYDIYQQPAPRTNHYTVVAIWPTTKAFDVHETAAHTRQFRSTSAMPGRANLYDERLYKGL